MHTGGPEIHITAGRETPTGRGRHCARRHGDRRRRTRHRHETTRTRAPRARLQHRPPSREPEPHRARSTAPRPSPKPPRHAPLAIQNAHPLPDAAQASPASPRSVRRRRTGWVAPSGLGWFLRRSPRALPRAGLGSGLRPSRDALRGWLRHRLGPMRRADTTAEPSTAGSKRGRSQQERVRPARASAPGCRHPPRERKTCSQRSRRRPPAPGIKPGRKGKRNNARTHPPLCDGSAPLPGRACSTT